MLLKVCLETRQKNKPIYLKLWLWNAQMANFTYVGHTLFTEHDFSDIYSHRILWTV